MESYKKPTIVMMVGFLYVDTDIFKSNLSGFLWHDLTYI